MNNENRLSHIGLVEINAEVVKDLKSNFKQDILVKNDGLVTKGYFIGKALLNSILSDNEESAGILISFGMNDTIEEGGQLQLIIEYASGIEADDEPNIIGYLRKYATAKKIGPPDPDPDGGLPMIKPKPPTGG
jgi:hypothetical protein